MDLIWVRNLGLPRCTNSNSMDPPCVLLQALVVAESLCAQLALPEFRTSMNHLPVPLEGGEGFACE